MEALPVRSSDDRACSDGILESGGPTGRGHNRSPMNFSNGPAYRARDFSTLLLPIMAAVFAAFLIIGVALPVLPLHVHDDLGLGPFVVGLVAGSQFAASFLTRIWAGSYCDRRGSKRGLVLGLLVAAASGLLYLVSLLVVAEPVSSVTILFSVARCWARPKVLSSPAGSAGAWR